MKRRWLIAGLGALATILVLVAGGLWAVLWSSLPRTAGTLDVPGLVAPVEVARDGHGIPVITAENSHDAFLALGFTHAQDRLFQMDFLRRLASGRLAEAIGPAGLPSDRAMRTLGLRQAAEAGLAALDEPTRRALDAYAAGVNAYLDTRRGFLPPEFLALGIRPEPWSPVDSLLWQRLMALRLSGNWYDEALRASLLDQLPADAVAELWPSSRADAPTTVTARPVPGAAFAALLDAWPDTLMPTLASNAWVLDGTRTASGAPLLANDPHLGFAVPILWYLAEVRTPDWRVSGATVPGVPFHIVGHNGHLAWGMTTTHSDTMDLFVEDVVNNTHHATPTGPRPFVTRTETITVRGGTPETLTIRQTRKGPVVSDLLAVDMPPGTLLSLSAAALAPDDRSAQAMRRLNRAETWAAAERALADWHAPHQNFLVADTGGTIAFIAAGRVPVRAGGRGLVPRPAADSGFDWRGWLAYPLLPRLVSPAGGAIVNANNRPVPDSYPHNLGVHWPAPHRAMRITERLDTLEQATAEDMRALQMDALSLVFAELWPLMAATPAATPAARAALDLLERWDGTMAADRAEPLIFAAWRSMLERRLFADDLGPLFGHWEGNHPRLLRRVLAGDTDHPWCDDITTPMVETCTDQLKASLGETLDSLKAEFGPPSGWRWGDAHRTRLSHPLFSRVGVLDRLTTADVELDGSDETINRGGYANRAAEPGNWRHRFARRHGAGLRAVYDLSDLDASGYVIAGGQSGHLLAPTYADMVPAWRDGRLVTIGGTGARRTVLLLVP